MAPEGTRGGDDRRRPAFFAVQPEGDGSTTVEFNTNPAPGQTVNEATVGRYSVDLKSLDPYPQSPEDPVLFKDYRATLVVRKR